MKHLTKIAVFSLLLLSLLIIFSCAENRNNRKLAGDWELIAQAGLFMGNIYYTFQNDGTSRIVYGFRDKKPRIVPITDFDLDDRDNLTMKMKSSTGKTVKSEYPVKFLSKNLVLLVKKQGGMLLSRVYFKTEDDDLFDLKVKYDSVDYHIKVNVHQNQAPELVRDDHKIENELIGQHFADIEKADPPLYNDIKKLLGNEFGIFSERLTGHNRLLINDDYVFISTYPHDINNYPGPGEAVLLIYLYDYSLCAAVSDKESGEITVFSEKKVLPEMKHWVKNEKGNLLKDALKRSGKL